MYKVLLVDDEPAALDMEKRAIQKRTENFQVSGEAYNVKDAIELYHSITPDVVLTDMKMPRQNGIELRKYIAGQEVNKAVCIAVSGYSDFDYVHDAFSYGAFDYLLKPVEPKKIEELFVRIRRLLISTRENPCTIKLPQGRLSTDQLVKNVEEHIRKNIAGDNSILNICSIFSISQPYLSKAFKMHFNCTYNEYLIGIRIEEAKKLLDRKEEYLIGEIAELLGFSDQFYFSKVFKNTTGYTPREYRGRNDR